MPRKALPAVQGAVRAHGTTVETSRAVRLLNEQAQIAERIKANFPDLPQLDSFQNAIRASPDCNSMQPNSKPSTRPCSRQSG